ncbi:MAG: hypothetical protein AAB486_01820 [Patescibacteria group bacterium]
MCKKTFGRYLPVAGNIGIFCHFNGEYQFLTKIREQLTEKSDNWNHKYYRLHEPLKIPAQGDIPDTVYTYLYIRKPDHHSEVGDVDFVLKDKEYRDLKERLLQGSKIKGIEVLNRPDLDLIKLLDPEIDTLSFIGAKYMAENVLVKD